MTTQTGTESTAANAQHVCLDCGEPVFRKWLCFKCQGPALDKVLDNVLALDPTADDYEILRSIYQEQWLKYAVNFMKED